MNEGREASADKVHWALQVALLSAPMVLFSFDQTGFESVAVVYLFLISYLMWRTSEQLPAASHPKQNHDRGH